MRARRRSLRWASPHRAADQFRLRIPLSGEVEAALARHPYLAGDPFSLADIGVAPYVNRLAMLGISELWNGSRPRVTDC